MVSIGFRPGGPRARQLRRVRRSAGFWRTVIALHDDPVLLDDDDEWDAGVEVGAVAAAGAMGGGPV